MLSLIDQVLRFVPGKARLIHIIYHIFIWVLTVSFGPVPRPGAQVHPVFGLTWDRRVEAAV